MSEQGITAEEVREIAAGAIAGWAPGWTGDDGVNPQRRVRVAGLGDGHVDLRVEGAPGTGEPDRVFRVTLTVAELVTATTLRGQAEQIRQDILGTAGGPVHRGPYIAPVETGDRWRSGTEREWDDSRGGD